MEYGKTKEEVIAGMDEAARGVRPEFQALVSKYPDAAKEFGSFFKKNIGKVGYKRLAKMLIDGVN